MTEMRRYRAVGLARQEVYIAIDKALKAAGIKADPYLELAHVPDDENFPTVNCMSRGIQNKTFFLRAPAAAISSDLLHKQGVKQMNIAAHALIPARHDDRTKLFSALTSALEDRLHANRNLFFGLSLEAFRMLQDDDATFSDNLMMEVADVVICIMPIGLALEQINPLGYQDALAVARLAVEIRSQIAWGMVEDYDEFRKDVLALFAHLHRLIATLNMSPTLLTRFDPDAMTEKLRAYLRQPLLQMM